MSAGPKTCRFLDVFSLFSFVESFSVSAQFLSIFSKFLAELYFNWRLLVAYLRLDENDSF